MIHVYDFNDKRIDFISKNERVIREAVMDLDVENKTWTYEFYVRQSRSEHFKKRHTLVTKDNMGLYREFVIVNTLETIDGWVFVRTIANHTDLLRKERPIEPTQLNRATVHESQQLMLADTTIDVAPDSEYGGTANPKWEVYRYRDEIESIIENAFDMRAEHYLYIDENHNKERFQRFKKVNPIFKGFDITYGKNMLGLKREIDTTDVVTSLLCLGPEDEEGNRLVEVVQDDEAMQQFGIKHKWGLYEPQSEDTNMTRARLRTLGKTELNKRKMASVSYEATVIDRYDRVSTGFQATTGDMVRIKNEDFRPELYVDAEITGLTYRQLERVTTYRFGVIKEYTRDDVYEWLNKNISKIRDALKDFKGNTETLIEDIKNEFKDNYEFKIIESDTEPKDPENGQLWLDTSEKDRGISTLYRWNKVTGKWDKVTPTEAHEVGAVTKEESWYSELVQTLEAVNIAHSGYTNDVTEALNNQYLVDNSIRSNLNSLFSQLDDKLSQASNTLNSMTGENATLGELAGVQNNFVEYRTILVELLKELARANSAIDERFKLLQSQYTEEKFNEAMGKVADGIGGTWTGDKLIAPELAIQDDLDDLNQSIRQYLNGEIDSLDKAIGSKVETLITNTKGELSASISSVDKKIDGLEIGGRNLILNSEEKITSDKYLVKQYALSQEWKDNQTYTLIIKGSTDATTTFRIWRDKGLGIGAIGFTNKIDETMYSLTFKTKDYTGSDRLTLSVYQGVNDGSNRKGTIEWIKLVEGNKTSLDWSPAPEDTEEEIKNAQRETQEALENYSKAQAELAEQEAKAFAETKFSEEQERAIAEAQRVLEDAKTHADTELSKEQQRAIEEAERVLNDAKGYALDNVSEERQRAIQDAKDKLDEAKRYAEQKKQEAIDTSKNYADEQDEKIRTTVRKLDTTIELLEEEIELRATKQEVTQTLNNALAPIKKDVEDNIATLNVQAEEIASKVSKNEYTTDQNDIVKKLNRSETVQEQLSDEINRRITVEEYSKGTENLITDSDFSKRNANGWSSIYGTQKVENGTLIKTVTSNTPANRIERVFSNLEVDETYTLSLCIKTPIALNWRTFVDATLVKSNGDTTTDEFHVNTVTFKANSETVTIRGYIANAPIGSTVEIDWFKLEEGSIATPYEKSPKDTDEVLTRHETEISENRDGISSSVKYEQFNQSNKTLERLMTELNQTNSGLEFQIDTNGTIQGFNLNKDQFRFDSQMIEFNDGDVIIKDGRTTIKQAFINNLEVKELFSRTDTSKLNIDGGALRINRADGYTLDFGVDEIVVKNGAGTIMYRAGRGMSLTAGIGTTTGNVYLAPRDGFEVRVAALEHISGDGVAENYKYLPIRTEGIKGPPSQDIYYGSDGEHHFKSMGLSSGSFKPIRASTAYVNRVESHSTGLFYIGTNGSEVRVVNYGTTDVYSPIRASTAYVNRVESHATGLFYIGTSGAEARVVKYGTTDVFAPLRASRVRAKDFYPSESDYLTLRHVHGAEARVMNGDTTNFGTLRTNTIIYSNWSNPSLKSLKENIRMYKRNVLEDYKNNLDITLFNYVGYPDEYAGIVIGEGYKVPRYLLKNGTVQMTNVVWNNAKAIQELALENDELKLELKELKIQINKVMEKIL